MDVATKKERPILFSGPMVRALLDGSKTQTRRVVRKQFGADAIPAEVPATSPEGWQVSGHSGRWWDDVGGCDADAVNCPFGIPGDRLWVRETFLYVGPGSGSDLPSYREERANPENHEASNCWFRASQPDETLIWTPSIHMPRWASRITLEVTGVRVERLQDISRGDAMDEGCPFPNMAAGDDPRQWFAALWSQINGTQSWESNPWVWVVEFRRIA